MNNKLITNFFCFFLILIFVLVFPACSSASNSADPIDYYVSPNGNDNANGKSSSTAFKTIERAKLAIRTLKKDQKITKSIKVILMDGTYYLNKPLKFSNEDGGSASAPIMYTAEHKNKAVISGGLVVSNWTKEANNIWSAQLPSTLNLAQYQTNRIYLNGEERFVAKLPSNGFYRADYRENLPTMIKGGVSNMRFFKNDIPRNLDVDNVEVLVYHFWTDNHFRIKNINWSTSVFNFNGTTSKRFSDGKSQKLGARYFINNASQGVKAGMWYLDKSKNKIYYYPKANENLKTAKVVFPLLNDLFEFNGNSNNLIKYLYFNHLTFTQSGAYLAANSTNDGQGASAVNGSISLKNTQYCIFNGCYIANIENYAFDFQAGSKYNSIINCKIENIGGGAIRMNGGGAKTSTEQRTSNNSIKNNFINNYGVLFPSSVGIFLMHTGNDTISHNTIQNGYYTAISVGYTWGYGESVAKNNIIEFNQISNIGQGMLSDLGGIYTLGVSTGTVINNNLIHDIKADNYGGWGIYNDEGSSDILIENNIVYNSQASCYNIHYGKNLKVVNNIFAFGGDAQITRSKNEPYLALDFSKNIVYSGSSKSALLGGNWSSSYSPNSLKGKVGASTKKGGQILKTLSFKNNIYYNSATNTSNKLLSTSSSKISKSNPIAESFAIKDPLFTNPLKGDFSLKPGSPAKALGFKNIDVKNIGADMSLIDSN